VGLFDLVGSPSEEDLAEPSWFGTEGARIARLRQGGGSFDDTGERDAGDAAEGGSESPVSLLAIPGYIVGEELARGGMGIVYRARQYAPARDVALKMLLPFSASLPELRERFQLEVRTLAELDHPAILPIYETGDYEGLPWFSMKLATGGSLASRIETFSGRWREIAALIATLADAAHFAHERGVLHRDLKPGNILFDAEERPFMADFGLAKLVGEESDFTRTHRAMGTPRYLAPEVASSSARHATTASDVYSLGAILFELLTGRPPFEAEGLPALLGRIVTEEPRFPNQTAAAKIPSDLQVIAIKCLAKNPVHRYASARELADELRRYLAGEPIQARPVNRAEKLWRWARREPALASALGACVLSLLVGVLGILGQLRETESARAVAVQNAKNEQAQRAVAEAARSEAQQSELVMRQNLYAADMLAAQRSIEQHDLGTARVLLDAHRPKAGQSDLRGFEWRYFWGKARGQSFAALKPNDGVVTVLKFSADGSYLALGSWNTYLYEIPSLALRARIDTGNIQSLAFVPNSDAVILGIRGPSDVRRWKPGDQGMPSLFLDPKGRWPNVAVSPQGDVLAVGTGTGVAGSPDGSTTLYNATTGTLRQALPKSGGLIRFSPDGKFLATGSWEGEIKLWEPITGTLVSTLQGAPRTVSLRFSPDGRWLVVCTVANGVLLYNLTTGTSRPVARGHTAPVWDAEISPDGRLLATCSGDQSVRVWELESGRQKAELRGHSYTVSYVAWSPDGKVLASGGHDGARFWDVEAVERVEKPLEGAVRNNFFSPDGRWLAVKNADASVALHDYPALTARAVPHATGLPLGYPGTGDVLVTFQQRNKMPAQILRWSVPEFRLLSTMELADSSETLVVPVLSPNGRWLVAGTSPGRVGWWDLEKNVLVGRLGAPIPGVGNLRAVAISPDGRYVVGSFQDWPILIFWDFSTAKPTRVDTIRHRGQVMRLVFSADGRTLVSSDSDKFIKIWDVETKLERATLLGHRFGVIDVDISPDGRTIASTSDDGTVRLWNTETRREVARFEMQGVMDRVTFAPDGNALLLTSRASAGRLSTTAVWRVPTLGDVDDKSTATTHPARIQ
jgi:eukaryotic-like serine/threonine-protein kinase